MRVHERLDELYAIGGGVGANRVAGTEGEDRAHELAAGWMRDAGLDGLRPHTKYIDRLDDIRRVQDYIVRRAKRHNVPVIANTDIRAQIDSVLELVLASAEQVQRV